MLLNLLHGRFIPLSCSVHNLWTTFSNIWLRLDVLFYCILFVDNNSSYNRLMGLVIIFFAPSLEAWFFIILLISTSKLASFHLHRHYKWISFVCLFNCLWIWNFFFLNVWFPRCILRHPAAMALEEWISTKDYKSDVPLMAPMWHVSNDDEVQFANELLNLHFQSALDDLLKICQNRIHSDAGMTQPFSCVVFFLWLSVVRIFIFEELSSL